MKTRETIAGKTWVVTSPNGCTVTQTSGSTTITTEVPANVQTLVLAQTGRLEISDDAALVTEVGGSAELIYRMESGEGGSCDCEPLTAEAIQAVMPVAWKEHNTTVAPSAGFGGIAIGFNSRANVHCVAIGENAQGNSGDTVVGQGATTGTWACAFGYAAKATTYSFAAGINCSTTKTRGITIGTQFTETTDSGNVTHTCTTEGTGSITIGAGANTLNNGDVESSNSITIGCKASNSGADSVVIGAGASGAALGGVAIGSLSQTSRHAIAVGHRANNKAGGGTAIGTLASSHEHSTSVGYGARSLKKSVAIGSTCHVDSENSIGLGYYSNVTAQYAAAIGANAKVSDLGATVIRSTAEDGTYTQLYFSGANTPLANTYHDGAPMLGYVTKDSADNIVAAGTRSLIDLLTDNSTFAPASLDENGEWVQPTVFHPSDLDLPPQEAPTEEEYTPMPVYPIVEPEMTEEV